MSSNLRIIQIHYLKKICLLYINIEHINYHLNLLLNILDCENLTKRENLLWPLWLNLDKYSEFFNNQWLEIYVLLSELFYKKQVFLVKIKKTDFFMFKWLLSNKIFVIHMIVFFYFHRFINFIYLFLYYFLWE